MSPPSGRAPLTDSPWFWGTLYTGVGLAMLLATGGKFGQRQSGIERQYQARQAVASGEMRVESRGDGAKIVENRPNYSTPQKTVVPLWPLEVGLTLIFVVSFGMFLRSRFGPIGGATTSQPTKTRIGEPNSSDDRLSLGRPT